MVAGHIAGAGDLAAVRAALAELFESFTLRRLDDGGDGLVELDLSLGDTYIEPKLRASAIVGWERVLAEDSGRTIGRPELRPVPLPLGGPDVDSSQDLSRWDGPVGRRRAQRRRPAPADHRA